MDGLKVISFSLYGDRELYTVGAVINAELVHKIYPGWVARFYVDETVPGEVVSALKDRGALGSPGTSNVRCLVTHLLWAFLPRGMRPKYEK
jgi:hypothetical protein